MKLSLRVMFILMNISPTAEKLQSSRDADVDESNWYSNLRQTQ